MLCVRVRRRRDRRERGRERENESKNGSEGTPPSFLSLPCLTIFFRCLSSLSLPYFFRLQGASLEKEQREKKRDREKERPVKRDAALLVTLSNDSHKNKSEIDQKWHTNCCVSIRGETQIFEKEREGERERESFFSASQRRPHSIERKDSQFVVIEICCLQCIPSRPRARERSRDVPCRGQHWPLSPSRPVQAAV
jgi:hypothetical protein